MRKSWRVYILECRDKSLYTGITSNLCRRLKEHMQGRGGRYTKSFGAATMLYNEKSTSRSAALKRELQIKSWPRSKKMMLIEGSLTLRRANKKKK